MAKFICHGCGQLPCRLEAEGLDVTDLSCVVKFSDAKDAQEPNWKIETDTPTDFDPFDPSEADAVSRFDRIQPEAD